MPDRGHLLILTFALGLACAPSSEARVKVGEKAPPFTVTTFGGDKVSLEDLRGQVVVLNYWATWCGPCRRELPVLNNFYVRHPRHDLKILAVDTEDSIPQAKLRPLAASLNFPLIARMSGGGYGIIGGLPTSYVIDRAGIVRYAKAEAFDAASFEAVVAPLLAEPPPRPAPSVAGAVKLAAKPVWVEVPNADDMAAVYPAKALTAHLGGRAVIQCAASADGGLSGCMVTAEEPAGEGFGQAAMSLTPKFRMQTALQDGAPASGLTFSIPIRFKAPAAVSAPPPPDRALRYTKEAGSRGPGPYYPEAAAHAGVSGAALLECDAAASTGVLSNCALVEEAPQLQSFGAAALKMAERAWIFAEPTAESRRVRLTIVFKATASH